MNADPRTLGWLSRALTHELGAVQQYLAQSALASARLQRIQAQLDWNVYRATLAQSMGALDYTLLQPAVEGRP